MTGLLDREVAHTQRCQELKMLHSSFYPEMEHPTGSLKVVRIANLEKHFINKEIKAFYPVTCVTGYHTLSLCLDKALLV